MSNDNLPQAPDTEIQDGGRGHDHDTLLYYGQDCYEAGVVAGQRDAVAASGAGGAGWKLVPSEETPEWRAKLQNSGYSHRTVIRDILAAAPTPERATKAEARPATNTEKEWAADLEAPKPDQVRDETLEEAAKECLRTERRPVEQQHCGDVDYLVNDYPVKCAAAIRALKATPLAPVEAVTDDEKARLVLDAMDACDQQSEAAAVEMSPREHAALLYDLLSAAILAKRPGGA
jgi:hypothetical protein